MEGSDMKKLLILLSITMAVVLCLGACGGNTDDVSQADEPEYTEEYEEEVEDGLSLGDYTIMYFQSGPLILVNDNKVDGYNYYELAENLEKNSLKEKLQDSLILVNEMNGPIDLTLMIKRMIKDLRYNDK